MSDNTIKVLRPGDGHLAGHPMPTRAVAAEIPKIEVTQDFIEQYNAMPASEVRRRYESDKVFAYLVDEMLKQGESNVV